MLDINTMNTYLILMYKMNETNCCMFVTIIYPHSNLPTKNGSAIGLVEKDKIANLCAMIYSVKNYYLHKVCSFEILNLLVWNREALRRLLCI